MPKKDRPALELREIEIMPEMYVAGAAEYRDWESDPREQRKLNKVANLVDRVYRSMQRSRPFPE